MFMIRPATEADLPALRPLLDQLGYPVPAPDLLARFRDLQARAGHVLLVAIEADRPVGFAFASVHRDLLAPPLAHLDGLVVDETIRSKGIGAALLAAMEAWARSEGVAGVTVGTRVERERAHKFYEANGYTLAKQWRVYRKHFQPGA